MKTAHRSPELSQALHLLVGAQPVFLLEYFHHKPSMVRGV